MAEHVKPRIFNPHRLDEKLSAAARTARLSPGNSVLELESRLAELAGRKHCLLTSSGRAALKAGMKALGAGKGSVVGMTNLTHPSAPEAAAWAGAGTEFIEISAASLNMDDGALRAKIRKLDALLATHMFAASCDLPRALKACAKAGIPLLEDASQIIGETLGGKPYGSFGAVSVFSLSPYKPVSSPAGKAGAILCDDDALFRRIKTAAGEFGGPESGLVPFLLIKIKILPSTLDGIKRTNAAYRAGLSGIHGLFLPAAGRAAHEFPVLTARRAELARRLTAAGVPLERVYKPFNPSRGAYPVSARYAAQALHLPAYPMMAESETEYVIKTVRNFFSR
jgi:dTDP-4-amino-4,6-dideoxygalactose transaminase